MASLTPRSVVFCLLVSAVPTSAQAGESPSSIDGVELADASDVIVVTGQRESGYGQHNISSATKTDTPLKEVPQAVSVVTAEQIADQGMRSIVDALRYVPGVALSSGEGHRDQVAIRGNVSTADFFVDGIRDDVQYYRGLYNLQRIEVLKGPNAMIFGRGGGGGVVNRVTKRPLHERFAHGAASLDSYGAGFVEADLNAPLAATVAGRVNAVYEAFDNFRDHYDGHRLGLNPTLAWTPGPNTRLDIGVEYARDRRVIDRGIPSARPGSIDNPARALDGHDDTFFGISGVNRSRFTGKVADVRLEHRFSDRLRLVGKALYGDYDKAYTNAFAATAVSDGQVGIEAYRDPTKRRNLFAQTDLIADVTTGPVRHTLLAGIDVGDQNSRNRRINGFFDTAGGGRRVFVDLADELDIPAVTFRDGPGNRSVRTRADALGFYVQDQLKFGEHVEVVAGLRRDRFALEVDNLLAGTSFDRTDKLWSPRLGLVLKPLPALSLYASWSRSFLPQSGDQFSSLDVTLAALKPERFTNREIGVKWQPVPAFDVTLAAYTLDRTNTRETDPVTLQSVLTGEQRSKGLELTVQGRPLPHLSLSGGLALQDVEIRRSAVPGLAGRTVPLVPDFQASLWGRYDFTPRIGGGLGVYHQSKSYASISNAVVVPAFTRLDAAGFFKLAEAVELQVNVENLLDSDYIALAYNDNNLTPANPRTFRATVRFGF